MSGNQSVDKFVSRLFRWDAEHLVIPRGKEIQPVRANLEHLCGKKL